MMYLAVLRNVLNKLLLVVRNINGKLISNNMSEESSQYTKAV